MLQELIKEWSTQYGVDHTKIQSCYSNLGNHLLGLTSYPSRDPRTARIQVHEFFEDYPLASKSVLWHEYCHAEKWLKDGRTDGHGSAWLGRCWRKPLLTILDLFYTQILFIKYKLKK